VVVSGRDVVHVRDGVSRVLLALEGVVGFNDLTTDAAGRVFVGSLRTSAFETGPRTPGELWRIDGEGRATEVYGDVEFPNGVGFSPDGGTVYHSNYSEGVVLAHDVGPDGAARNRRVFARVPRGHPDGLAVDEAGGVWVALGSARAIARFHPGGAFDRAIEVPAEFVASLCFGGADRRDAYVATAGALYHTRVEIPGLVAPLARV
jgi:sugar lactone lactonase YvrE